MLPREVSTSIASCRLFGLPIFLLYLLAFISVGFFLDHQQGDQFGCGQFALVESDSGVHHGPDVPRPAEDLPVLRPIEAIQSCPRAVEGVFPIFLGIRTSELLVAQILAPELLMDDEPE